MKEVPVTLNFNHEKPVGFLRVDESKLIGEDWVLAPGFVRDSSGKTRLVEVAAINPVPPKPRDPRGYLIDLLKQLERAFPPARGCHHAVHFGQYGSDATGWEEQLCLTMNLGGKQRTLFLESGDLGKPVEVITSDIATILSQGD